MVSRGQKVNLLTGDESMFQRNWFFLMEALQITAGERRVILGLISVYMVLTAFNLFGPERTIYNDSYYKPVIDEFVRLSGIRDEERAVLLARYYPPETRNAVASLLDGNTYPGQANLVTAVEPVYKNESSAQDRPGSKDSGATTDDHADAKINIQQAGVDELISLPGIGPVTAGRIIEYREKNGPFRQPEDLLNVSGIGPVTLENIREYIIVGVDPDIVGVDSDNVGIDSDNVGIDPDRPQ